MARMKVVLREALDTLGEVGDVVVVAGGYARNYLIPRGLAVPATKGNVKQAEDWKESKAARQQKALREASRLKTLLEAQPLQVRAQAGPDGRLFGQITNVQVADAIREQLEADVDRHTIEIPEPIRHLGFHEAHVRLHPEVGADLTVEAIEESPTS